MINSIVRILFVAAFSFLMSALPSEAAKFQDEIDKAAKAGELSSGQASAFKSLFSKSRKLRNLNISDVKVSNGAITGIVNFLKKD